MLALISIVCGAGLTVLTVGLGLRIYHRRQWRRLLREYRQADRRIEARYETAALLAIQHYFTRHRRG